MALYRLDYIDTNGEKTGPVEGWHIGILPTGDVLTRHMTTARARAVEAAKRAECDVLVSRIGKAGAIRAALVVQPDGRARRPGGMSGEDCKRDSGQACFCRNCRAGRRAR